MSIRDGGPADPLAAQNQRSLLGAQLYLAQSPHLLASVVIDNRDVPHPLLPPAA